MAYASKIHEIAPTETNRSLSRLHDKNVLLMSGFGGVLGYLLNCVLIYVGIPIDTGALTVLSVGLLARILFSSEKHINYLNLHSFKGYLHQNLVSNFLLTVTSSLIVAVMVKLTGVVSIGFSISALSLIFTFKNPKFPVTHHITMVAGYAVSLTGSLAIAVLAGCLSHILFLYFGQVFNDDCGTYVDPPAFAISSISFLLMSCSPIVF